MAQKVSCNVHCSHSLMLKVEDLKPHPKNPNKHPANQIKLLAKIISEQGWRAPIVISKRSNLITKGHGRRLAALLLNLEEVPVDYQEYTSDESEIADVIADNKIASLAELDVPMIKELLSSMDTGAIDLTLTGYDDDELQRLLAPVIDEEVGQTLDKLKCRGKARNRVQRGEIYQVGPHILFCMDVFSEWQSWVGYLEEGCLFLPYPGPLVPLGSRSGIKRFVMVQPIEEVASHLLDSYEDVYGEGSVNIINVFEE